MQVPKTAARKKKNKKWYLLFYLHMLLALLTLVVTASYTWFILSRPPRVSNLKMTIATEAGLELSPDYRDEAKWTYQLNYLEMIDESSPLRPITWSDNRQQFVTAMYGADGRIMGYDWWHLLYDSSNANRNDVYGYYIKTTFYARSGQRTNVTFTPAKEVNEGIDGSGTYAIGNPNWDGENLKNTDGGQGAQSAIRLGFRFTKIQENGKDIEQTEVPKFYIYEPNCDTHFDGSTGYVPTSSIDGAPTLVPEDQLIRQTTSTWKEREPVLREQVDLELGEFLERPTLFTLVPGDVVQIDMYVWLEGQDMDCNNQMSAAQIIANLQFGGSEESQSGMVPIE